MTAFQYRSLRPFPFPGPSARCGDRGKCSAARLARRPAGGRRRTEIRCRARIRGRAERAALLDPAQEPLRDHAGPAALLQLLHGPAHQPHLARVVVRLQASLAALHACPAELPADLRARLAAPRPGGGVSGASPPPTRSALPKVLEQLRARALGARVGEAHHVHDALPRLAGGLVVGSLAQKVLVVRHVAVVPHQHAARGKPVAPCPARFCSRLHGGEYAGVRRRPSRGATQSNPPW
jgi:hypothetical protein